LVFVSKLVRSGNARHTKYHGRQAKCSCVVMNILVGRTLGAAIRRVEVQRLDFRSAILWRAELAQSWMVGDSLRGNAPVNFVGGREQQEGTCFAGASCFQNVQSSANIHFKIASRIYH